jgi:hypothetical protein
VEPRDGWLETRWFDAKTLQPTTRRPVGRDIVKVRGWANPAKPGFSEYEVETVFVPFIDPSRPARELESIVPGDHPVAKRVAATVKRLFDKYGEPVPAPPPSPGAKPRVDSTSKALPARPDSAKADTSRKPRADSTGKVSPARPDSAKADTNRKPAPPPSPPPPAPPSPLGGRR